MKKKNRKYNMLNDVSIEHIHMYRINLTHTLCIWGYHIFDSNFAQTIELNLHNLLLCRKIGGCEDDMDTVKINNHDEDNAGEKYIECLKVTIPKKIKHLMHEKQKKNDRMKKKLTHKQTHATTEFLGCLKNDDN